MAKNLKPVPKGKKGKGLSKLPKDVRNKMGFFGAGGAVNAHKEEAMKPPPKPRVRGYARGGGVTLTKSETSIIPDYEGPRTSGDYYDYLSPDEKSGMGSGLGSGLGKGKPVLPPKRIKGKTDKDRLREMIENTDRKKV